MAADSKNFIADASFLLTLLLPDEHHHSQYHRFLNLTANPNCHFFAPSLIESEVANALISAHRQKRITAKDIQKILPQFFNYPINYLPVDLQKTIDLSIKYRLSFYDASYLYLSLHHHYPLLTLDQPLAVLAK